MIERLSLCLTLTLGLLTASAEARTFAECDAFLTSRYGERVRTRDADNHGRAIFSPRENERTSNTQGFAMSTLDATDVRDQLFQAMNELGAENVTGDLSLSGLPLYHPAAQRIVDDIKQTLADLGLEASVRVVPMYAPAGHGLRKWIGVLRSLFPMKQDYEKPVSSEINMGAPGTLAAEATTVGYAFANFPAKVAVPLSVSHFGLLGMLATFTRTQTNWMNRSRNQYENLVKDFITSNVFIVNYSVMSNWPQIAASFAKNGPINPDFAPAAQNYLVNQLGVTGVVQTAFFYFTFINGLWRWQAIVDRKGDPELSRQARNAAAIIQPSIFAISGPVLNWASTSHRVLFSVGPVAVNPGQAALGCLTLLGCVAAAAPERTFTPLVGPINHWIYDPLTRTWNTYVEPRLARVRGHVRRWRPKRKIATLPN